MEPARRLKMTLEEYLEWDAKSEWKWEYYDGETWPVGYPDGPMDMAGADPRHNFVVASITGLLRMALKRRPCAVLTSDQRTGLTDTGLYGYPDVVVGCGKLRFSNDNPATLLNPILSVEVLSPSTESYDRGAKAAHYRHQESMQGYLLVDWQRRHVEHHRRGPGEKWTLSEAIREGTLELDELGVILDVAEVFEGLDLVEAAMADRGAATA